MELLAAIENRDLVRVEATLAKARALRVSEEARNATKVSRARLEFLL